MSGWVAGAMIVGSYVSYRQSKKAQDAQERAAREGLSEEQRQWNMTRAEMAPYRATGKKYLGKLDQFMEGDYDITQTPGYQFRLEEGMKSLQRSQAGRTLGGRAVKEITRYGQEYATGERGAEFNRLATLAGYGPQAAGISAAAAPNVAPYYGAIGQAGVMGAQGTNQAIQGGLSNYMTWQTYNQRNNQGGGYDSRLDTGYGSKY